MEDYGSAKPFWRHLGPVLFLVLIFLLNFIGRIILAPLLPSIEKELEISHSQAGSFFFLIATGYLVGLVASGFWAPHTTRSGTAAQIAGDWQTAGMKCRLSCLHGCSINLAYDDGRRVRGKNQSESRDRRFHRRGNQHGIGYSGFPQPRRNLDTLSTGYVPGICQQRSGAARGVEKK